MASRSDRPATPLRRQLITLVVVAVVPILLFAFVMVTLLGRLERRATERGLQDVSRALTLAVDRELETSVKALEALAASLYLDTGDLRSFSEHVQRVVPTQPRWRAILLTDAAGTVRLVSTQALSGAAGHSVGDREYFKELVATRKPVFSGLLLDRSPQAEPVIVMVVPVVRNGDLRYVLGATLDLNALSGFMAAHTVPADWTATILDRNGTVLARSREPEAWFGRPGSPALRGAQGGPRFAEGDDGGTHSYFARSQAAMAGWTVAVSVPTEIVDAPLRRSLTIAVAGGLVLLVVGAALAVRLGRRVSQPIEGLVDAAEALGRGEAMVATSSSITELTRLGMALATAGRERERVEEALRASEAQLRAIFTSTLDAIVVADDDGRYVDCNPAAEELFGASREALLGRSVRDFTTAPGAAAAAWEEFLRKGTATGILRLRRPDGIERDVEFSATADVMPGRHVSVLRDVTLRREAEDDLRRRERESTTIAALTQRMNARLDLDEILLLVCESARELCGADAATIALPDPGQPDTMTLRQRVARVSVPLPTQRIEHGRGLGGRVMETGRPLRSDDYAHDPDIPGDYHAIGEQLGTCAVLVVPISVDGHVDGLLYVANSSRRPFSDLDEAVLVRLADHVALAIRNARVLAREQAALAASEAANRSKDEFLATLSHELRTPLTSMLGWVRMLRGARLDPEQTARALETIERNTRLQAKLIDDLLDVSRIVAGKIKVEQQRVDVAAVVGEAVQSLRREADVAGVELDVALAADAGAILGDVVRLQQIVANLLSNAIKFTPAGGRIWVTLERLGRDSVQLVVRDTGAGIRPDLLPRIFDRFLQGDASRTRGRGGLGLGLAIVRHLVELHGGAIAATSDGPGQGATFTVTLPTAETTPRGETPPFTRAHAVNGRPLDGLRVLAVEDHDDSREVIRVALVERGAETVVVGSVDEALAVLDREPIDVLVSDVGMPHRDGYALVEALRELERARGRRPIPAIALTAYAGRDDRERLLAAGFQVHVAKPIDPDVLAETVARALQPR
ncbi:MAG TPA: ATP-binding protein [Methylomirabilota bacterium]